MNDKRTFSNSLEACELIVDKISYLKEIFKDIPISIGNYRSENVFSGERIYVIREGTGIEGDVIGSNQLQMRKENLNETDEVIKAEEHFYFIENFSVNILGANFNRVMKIKEYVIRDVYNIRELNYVDEEIIEEEVENINNNGENLTRCEINISLPIYRRLLKNKIYKKQFVKVNLEN